jgi:hypothetical protein
MTIVDTELLPLAVEDIRNFMMKTIKFASFTVKKDLVDALLEVPKYVKLLEIPFYLTIFTNYLSRQNL